MMNFIVIGLSLIIALRPKSNGRLGAVIIKDFETVPLLFFTSKYFIWKFQPCPSYFCIQIFQINKKGARSFGLESLSLGLNTFDFGKKVSTSVSIKILDCHFSGTFHKGLRDCDHTYNFWANYVEVHSIWWFSHRTRLRLFESLIRHYLLFIWVQLWSHFRVGNNSRWVKVILVFIASPGLGSLVWTVHRLRQGPGGQAPLLRAEVLQGWKHSGCTRVLNASIDDHHHLARVSSPQAH